MKLGAAIGIALLTWCACSLAGPAWQAGNESGKTFSLRAGESVDAGDGDLRVGFEGVYADSRCPKREQCVRAGEATATVWFQRGSGPRQSRELRTAPGAAPAASAFDHVLRLMRLDPYPITGRQLAPGDYVATLTLSRGSATEALR
ncbi:MAG: hypothetical protein H7Z19_00370 [Chitinophagaceae bacterium]|nr:hypothetical protein [Rubrivivax sp.]